MILQCSCCPSDGATAATTGRHKTSLQSKTHCPGHAHVHALRHLQIGRDLDDPCNGHRSDGSAVAAEFYVLNALTPRNEKSTHYFWGLVRNFSIDDPAVTELQQKLNRETFFEDVEILSQQQIMLDSAPAGWMPVSVPNDGGCVQADRMCKKLHAQEQNQTGSQPH